MTGREILAGAIRIDRRLRVGSDDDMADSILDALTASGYRILAPGDLDKVTLERAAEHFSKVAGDAGFGVFKSSTVSAAIRSLGGET